MKKELNEYELFRLKIVNRLKERRKELNLTQENMEDGDWSINVRTYQRIENLDTDISLKNLYIICKKLNIPLEELLK